MIWNFEAQTELADAEFEGESYNGSSLLSTLSGLSATNAAAPSSHEGYSAWSVASHVAYCKWVVADALFAASGEAGARLELGAYALDRGEGGFVPPALITEEAWRDFLSYLAKIHRLAMRAIREAPLACFDKTLELWAIPLGKAAAWLCCHDSYHNAQIRSMGVPGLREGLAAPAEAADSAEAAG